MNADEPGVAVGANQSTCKASGVSRQEVALQLADIKCLPQKTVAALVRGLEEAEKKSFMATDEYGCTRISGLPSIRFYPPLSVAMNFSRLLTVAAQ
jgi:hypothetical protein